MKLGLAALGLAATTVLLAGIAIVVAAIAAGPSITGGERALLAAAIFCGVLLLTATAAFWLASRGLRLVWRALATAGFAVVEIVLLGAALFLALVMLNR